MRESLELVLPNEHHREAVGEFKKDFAERGEELHGAGTLDTDDFDTWLRQCRDYMVGENLPLGHIASTQYLCMRGGENLVGMLNLRHELTPALSNRGGHIGYSVAHDWRGKGIGTRLLGLGIEKCRERGFDRVLVTCLESNVASARVIEKNGGVLEGRVRLADGRPLQRWWIEL